MSDDLKPCPFCGGDNVTNESDDPFYYVICGICGASSAFSDEEGAVRLWNARAERTCGEYRGDVYETPDGKSDDIELWCENCDIPLEDGWRHCPNCGAKVTNGEEVG